jgi:hypothetical protein
MARRPRQAGLALKLEVLRHLFDYNIEARLEDTGCPGEQHALSIVLQVARQMQVEV